jgi:hypothetical protein
MNIKKDGSVSFILGSNSIKKTKICMKILKDFHDIKYGKIIVNNEYKKNKYKKVVSESIIYTDYDKSIKEFASNQKQMFNNRHKDYNIDRRGFLILDCAFDKYDLKNNLYYSFFNLCRTFSIILVIVFDYDLMISPCIYSCIDNIFILNNSENRLRSIYEKISYDKLFKDYKNFRTMLYNYKRKYNGCMLISYPRSGKEKVNYNYYI